MNCEKYTNLIDDLIEDELDEQTVDEVSLHILDCQNCTAHFEMLEREKKMYSHYLFEIEPPSSLSAQFEKRLKAENPTATNGGIFSQFFAFLRFNPALVTATGLILLASIFSLVSLVKESQTLETVADSNNSQTIQMMLPPIKKDEIDVPIKPKADKEIIVKTKTEITQKPIAIKHTESPKIENQPPKVKTGIPKLSQEQAQLKELQNLEIETVKQLEKVELLLRSFRNARMIDGSEIYDVAYEKQQARKLLQTNVSLRQQSEIYGTLFTGEMLNKVEPYLLDIANLELDATPEQILEIKERVKSQNIIASLQGF